MSRKMSQFGTRCATLLLLFLCIRSVETASAANSTWPGTGASSRQPASATSPHPAVCRVSATSGNSVSYGSGSLVAADEKHGIVITNWHVVREATGQISVVFPDGFHSPARVIKVDRDWDLAALSVWRPQVAPIKLAAASPQKGEPLTIAGYGSGQYRAATGRCTQYVSPGKQLPFQMVEVSVAARQGDSGGPILNRNGELAGVLFGAGDHTTTGSYVGRVRWFLDSAGVPLDKDRTMIAQRPKTERSQPTQEGTIPPQYGVPLTKPSTPAKVDLASTTTPKFRTPRVSTPAKTAATANVQTISWQDVAGDTIFQQVKTFLAVFGLISLLVMGLRKSG
jgi:hypothetical protein